MGSSGDYDDGGSDSGDDDGGSDGGDGYDDMVMMMVVKMELETFRF